MIQSAMSQPTLEADKTTHRITRETKNTISWTGGLQVILSLLTIYSKRGTFQREKVNFDDKERRNRSDYYDQKRR